MFYINTIHTEQLPANLYSYAAAHPHFPDEPTLDQFFDEQQFEAYRELGCRITMDMIAYAKECREFVEALGLDDDGTARPLRALKAEHGERLDRLERNQRNTGRSPATAKRFSAGGSARR